MDGRKHTHTHTHTHTKLELKSKQLVDQPSNQLKYIIITPEWPGDTSGKPRCFICRWMVRQSCSFVQNLVVNYYLMISYTQQCHIVINANHHCDRTTCNLAFYIFSTAKIPRNFIWISGVETLWKGTVSAKFQKLCGNCVFPQNFYTRKLGEITWFFAVLVRKFD